MKADKWKTARQLFYIQQISFVTPRAMNMSQKNGCGRIPVILEVLRDVPQVRPVTQTETQRWPGHPQKDADPQPVGLAVTRVWS